MKLIHTSDLHIGSPMTARLPREKIAERRRELIESFRRVVEAGRAFGALGVIIAGDLFDSEVVTRRSAEAVASVIAEAPEMKFFYLPGNHEKRAFLDCGVKIPENLVFFDTGWTYFDFDGVRIAGRSETAEGMFSSLELSATGRNIVVLHGELRDRSAPGGVIGEREVPEEVDLLCLGHYHSYSEKKLSRRTTAVYCGTPEGRGFDETGEKGFALLDLSEGGVSVRFVPAAKRRLHIVSADLTGAKTAYDVFRAAEDAVREIPAKDLVRVLLTGGRSPDLRYGTEEIADRLAERFYCFEIKDESRLALNAEDYRYDKSLKGELIRLVSADESLSPDEKDAIIECGILALAGEV